MSLCGTGDFDDDHSGGSDNNDEYRWKPVVVFKRKLLYNTSYYIQYGMTGWQLDRSIDVCRCCGYRPASLFRGGLLQLRSRRWWLLPDFSILELLVPSRVPVLDLPFLDLHPWLLHESYALATFDEQTDGWVPSRRNQHQRSVIYSAAAAMQSVYVIRDSQFYPSTIVATCSHRTAYLCILLRFMPENDFLVPVSVGVNVCVIFDNVNTCFMLYSAGYLSNGNVELALTNV